MTRAEAYLKFAEKDYKGAAEGAPVAVHGWRKATSRCWATLLPHADDPRQGDRRHRVGGVPGRRRVSARVLVRLADAHYDAGRRDEAIRYYRLAAEKDPEHEWSCYRLAVLLGKDGGEEYMKRIQKDPTLVRMANAAWKEQTLDAK